MNTATTTTGTVHCPRPWSNNAGKRDAGKNSGGTPRRIKTPGQLRRIQRRGQRILTRILLKINTLGIVGLPVHDAIYEPFNRITETCAIMEGAFSELVGMKEIIMSR